MTRRDYETLARALFNARPGGDPSYSAPFSNETRTAWLAAVCAIADACMKDNTRFDPDRFLNAAGANS